MQTKDFSFDLPPHLIAQYPPSQRGKSKLMHLDCANETISHYSFQDIVKLLPQDALVVFNNTRVRKARLHAVRNGGGQVEILLLEKHSETQWLALVSKAKKQTEGTVLTFAENYKAKVIAIEADGQRLLQFDQAITEDYLEEHGKIPLPPYMNRESEFEDSERYQTIYADLTGSAAAPTAGLHFTDETFDALKKREIETAFITLHVGMGTFSPIRSELLAEHQIHTENFLVEDEQINKIIAAKKAKRPIIAVGTTVIRCLESIAPYFQEHGDIPRGWQKTSLFITPGYKFGFVDGIFTNFHTPESSLMVLIASYAGLDFIKRAYQLAIDEQYRFFSYGDCMFLYPPRLQAQ